MISTRQGRRGGLTGKGLRSRCEEMERCTGARKPHPSQRAVFAVPGTEEKGQEQEHWLPMLNKSLYHSVHPRTGY